MERYKDLPQRLMTAGILIGGLILLLIGAAYTKWGKLLLAGIGVVAVGIAAFEYATFSARDIERRYSLIARLHRTFMLTIAAVIVFLSALYFPPLRISSGIVTAILVFGLGLFIAGRSELIRVRDYVQTTSIALLLVGICGAYLIALALTHEGALKIFTLVAIVAVNDAAAYFGGSRLKGPKMCQALSPNKTVSGSICGFVGGVLAMLLIHYLARAGEDLITDLLIAAAVVCAAQLGDLAKSYLKRVHGVKDTGNILPGHGGVLDRIDAILAGAPLIYLWW